MDLTFCPVGQPEVTLMPQHRRSKMAATSRSKIPNQVRVVYFIVEFHVYNFLNLSMRLH